MLRKILCVDDQPIVHRMYDTVLAGYVAAGTLVIHTENGWQALKTLFDHPDTDLILLDLNMPVMNGHAFLEQKRKTELAAIPVIIVSTEGPADIQKALALGALDYLSKPFTFADLDRKIRQMQFA